MVINSVLGALITRPSSAASSAVLVSWDWARDIEDSRRTMSSAGHSAFWLDIFSTVEDRLPLHSQVQMPYPKGSQKEGGQNITLSIVPSISVDETKLNAVATKVTKPAVKLFFGITTVVKFSAAF